MNRYEQFERDFRNSTSAREAYARYLQGFEWDYFATITWKRHFRDSIKAHERVWEIIASHCERAFLAVERHRYPNHDCHVHGLIKVPRFSGVESGHNYWSAEGIWRDCYYNAGRSRVEAIRSAEDVSSYCSKYVVKRLSEYCFYGRPSFWMGS